MKIVSTFTLGGLGSTFTRFQERNYENVFTSVLFLVTNVTRLCHGEGKEVTNEEVDDSVGEKGSPNSPES